MTMIATMSFDRWDEGHVNGLWTVAWQHLGGVDHGLRLMHHETFIKCEEHIIFENIHFSLQLPLIILHEDYFCDLASLDKCYMPVAYSLTSVLFVNVYESYEKQMKSGEMGLETTLAAF